MVGSDVVLLALWPVLVLLALGILSALVSRLVRVNAFLGYIALGAMLSATGLGPSPDVPVVEILAELAVVFLLFDIGLRFSLVRVGEQARASLGLALVQISFNTLAVGTLLALVTDLDLLLCLLVGGILSLSSTAVVMRLIAERHQESCPVGEAAAAVLVLQDIAAIFLLILAAALGDTGSALGPALGAALLKGIAAFAIAVLLGRFAVLPVFRLIARSDDEEVFTAVGLLVALAAAWATGMIGLSLNLGAFLGGMIIAATPYRPIVQAETRPFRGLLLGFFFIAIGLSLDASALRDHWVLILMSAAVLMTVKAWLNAAAALVFRWSRPGAAQFGFLLAQGSEFALVLLMVPGVHALLGDDLTAVIIGAVALTLIVTPLVASLGRSLASRWRARSPHIGDSELVPGETPPPVLIIGMGTVGRRVADALTAFNIRYSAAERDHAQFLRAAADGYDVLFGDPGDSLLWEPVAMSMRHMVVLTAPSIDISGPLTPLAERFYPGAMRVAIVRHKPDLAEFEAAGLRVIVDEGEPRGLQGAAGVLGKLGIGQSSIAGWLKQQQELEARFREAASSHVVSGTGTAARNVVEAASAR